MKTFESPLTAVPELSLLREHMLRCAHARSPLHGLQCVAEAIDAFLAPRFVTTLAVSLLIMAGASLAI